MKIITVVAQQVSAQALSTALPASGVLSVTVSETQSFSPAAVSVQSYRGVKLAGHVTTAFRIEVAVDEDAVDAVIDGIAFARGAGLLGDARAWVNAATDLLAAPARALAKSA
jgi:nitrogen regulatory protein PII